MKEMSWFKWHSHMEKSADSQLKLYELSSQITNNRLGRKDKKSVRIKAQFLFSRDRRQTMKKQVLQPNLLKISGVTLWTQRNEIRNCGFMVQMTNQTKSIREPLGSRVTLTKLHDEPERRLSILMISYKVNFLSWDLCIIDSNNTTMTFG